MAQRFSTRRVSPAVAALLAGTISPVALHAAPIDLGAAGPAFWTVLQIGEAKIEMSNAEGVIAGNVGVAAGGEFKTREVGAGHRLI